MDLIQFSDDEDKQNNKASGGTFLTQNEDDPYEIKYPTKKDLDDIKIMFTNIINRINKIEIGIEEIKNAHKITNINTTPKYNQNITKINKSTMMMM